MALDIAKLEEEIKEEQQNEDKPPKTMEELYNLLYQLGSAWREENAYIVNEGQKNERTVTPQPNVSTVANVLENHCYFTFIGEGAISDVSKLYIYHFGLSFDFLQSAMNEYQGDKKTIPYLTHLLDSMTLSKEEFEAKTGEKYRRRTKVLEERLQQNFEQLQKWKEEL